ncbi:MAG: hypothetical protein ISEC1_P0180 [Thiomicrorhabdus sp.]|nr:MAG: hypothetical protein ISEC1_P0180 [Thiomicrorhabdus sp.]
MSYITKSSIMLVTIFISLQTYAASRHLIEHIGSGANDGLLKDTWVIKYQEDDFSEKVSNASLIYIPADYTKQKAFFMRCKDYFANFSVQYIDHDKFLKEANGKLPNASPSFAKHGYIYDDKQFLKTSTEDDFASGDISVGGQNRQLSKLFRTDIKKQPDMLAMSFHYSFTYREMPSFKAEKNSSDTINFFKVFQSALANNHNIHFELESDLGHIHKFTLDVVRLNQFVPKAVMQYCFTGRELR